MYCDDDFHHHYSIEFSILKIIYSIVSIGIEKNVCKTFRIYRRISSEKKAINVRKNDINVQQYTSKDDKLSKSNDQVNPKIFTLKQSIESHDDLSIDYLFKCHVDNKVNKLNYEIGLSRSSIYSENGSYSEANYNSDSFSCISYNQNKYNITPRKVLIVDDATINRRMLGKLLVQRGHYVEDAPNGLIGLNMFKATLNSSSDDLFCRQYDAIIMDIYMPVMTGISATQEIRSLGFKGPIIGVTSCIEYTVEETMLNAGADIVFLKPFKTEDIYATIER